MSPEGSASAKPQHTTKSAGHTRRRIPQGRKLHGRKKKCRRRKSLSGLPFFRPPKPHAKALPVVQPEGLKSWDALYKQCGVKAVSQWVLAQPQANTASRGKMTARGLRQAFSKEIAALIRMPLPTLAFRLGDAALFAKEACPYEAFPSQKTYFTCRNGTRPQMRNRA